MRSINKRLFVCLFICIGIMVNIAFASSHNNNSPQMSKDAQEIIAKNEGTKDTRGVITLRDYVIQEKARYDWIFKHHPIFTTYLPNGKVVGKLNVVDRGEEFVHAGHGNDFQKYSKRKGITSTMYRLPSTDPLVFPNKFVGPEKCGECHAAQYEKWSRSRHSSTIRFPGEHPEVNNELNKSVFGKDTASILPKGITPDSIYCTVGHLRTKMGYFDAWLLRGTYHVVGGLLKDGTGTVVAGSNQFQRTWANDLTPEVAKKIRKFIPNFPVTLEEHGENSGYVRGLASYAARYKKAMAVQAASSYCQVCHPWKFDYKTEKEFYADLGNSKSLQKHTISKGISCEECHGAGGHLKGGEGLRTSNCERCHQRFSFRPFLAEKFRNSKDPNLKARAAELGLTSKFKSAGPGCGTEGSQSYFTAHYEAGMRCTTCHDPHDVSGYVVTTTAKKGGVYEDTGDYLSSFYTKPAIRKSCASCHKEAAKIVKNTKDTHSKVSCASCHMPYLMSCENFYAVQYQDHAGFDTQRRSHIWKINVSPDKKTLNPPPGQPRVQTVPKKYKDWYIAKNDEGHNYIDLMWACGKTSWADKDMIDNKGCHSIVQSKLKKTLHFKDQSRIYDEVIGWQKPIKKIYSEVTVAIKGIYEMLEVTKLSVEDRSRVNELIEKAQEAMDLIKKDGSWGVHGFKYTERRAKAAQAYVQEAQNILSKASK
ncbi:cytochrome C [Malaciobacter molluscorum LMG 25693]|uniref:Cytochrome C n=1 Tax=Malaciobacter molluscorum LMG 25693 TaxID=870501 RepID=A0A2G1DKD2_9BACT|nr:multiheme c-type cytochrome [Malaciobacter molluscorum]AXX92936.1 putative cytochrome c [Malaciobacter molluscorum LMG 25693]PHO18766.1 cytochrome C [Malaciobacter molluscorum LMG 25693]